MKDRLKRWLFGLLGKDPDAVVVTFATGPPELSERMFAEVQRLEPRRRHFLVRSEDFRGISALRRQFRRYRIGLAPVLFTGEAEYRALRGAAFLLAPGKILAYNARLERHHIRPRTWIASLLFLRGIPLDRIFLRPRWLIPWKKDRSSFPTEHREFSGRPFTPGRKRAAVLTPYFPYPLSHGGAVRIYYLIREMARQFDVVLFSFSDTAVPDDPGPLLRECAQIFTIPKPRYREPRWSTLAPPEVAEFNSPAMRRLLSQKLPELQIDALQVEYTALAPYAGGILVEHDITFELYRQILERARGLISWWNYWRWRRFERRWVSRYPHTVVMSERDLQLLNVPGATVIPNGVDLERFAGEPERPGRRLLFIGSFRHFPNIVAFRFFFDQVWPLVRERSPGVTFTVVAGPEPLLYWREHTGQIGLPRADGLELHGFVADVRPFYVEANLVLVPTLVSAGTNLKVLEALAMRRAVVSTSSGCAGLELENRTNVWIADEPGEFAEAVLNLLDNHELRARMACAGRTHVERNFDWRAIGERQRALIHRAAGCRIALRPAAEPDVEPIWAIQNTAPEASQWHRGDYLSFHCTVAEIDGRIAGFLVSREIVPSEREILNIAVDPAYRRRGVATELIRGEIARWPGDHFLEVRESNQSARNLYNRLGFREVGLRPGYYENPPETGIVMRFYS